MAKTVLAINCLYGLLTGPAGCRSQQLPGSLYRDLLQLTEHTHSTHFFHTFFCKPKLCTNFTCPHFVVESTSQQLVRRSLPGVLPFRPFRSCILGNGFRSNRHTAGNFRFKDRDQNLASAFVFCKLL